MTTNTHRNCTRSKKLNWTKLAPGPEFVPSQYLIPVQSLPQNMQSPQVLLVLSVTLSTLALPILSSISSLYGLLFLISDWILWGKGNILEALFSCGGWFSFFLLLICRFSYDWGDWWGVLFCSFNLGQRDKLKAYVLESHKPNTISFSSTRYISLQSSCLPFFVKYVSSLVLEWICSTLVRPKRQNISFLLIIKGYVIVT